MTKWSPKFWFWQIWLPLIPSSYCQVTHSQTLQQHHNQTVNQFKKFLRPKFHFQSTNTSSSTKTNSRKVSHVLPSSTTPTKLKIQLSQSSNTYSWWKWQSSRKNTSSQCRIKLASTIDKIFSRLRYSQWSAANSMGDSMTQTSSEA